MIRSTVLFAALAAALLCDGCANPAAEKVSALHGDWYCKTDTSLTTLKFGEDGGTYTRSSYRNGFYMPVTGSYSADGSAGTVSCTLNSVTITYNFSIASDSSTLTLTSTDGSAADEIYTKGTPAFPATGLSFGNNSSFAMLVGKSIALQPAVSPLYSSDTISWSLSDPTVATVSENAADRPRLLRHLNLAVLL